MALLMKKKEERRNGVKNRENVSIYTKEMLKNRKKEIHIKIERKKRNLRIL